MNHSISKCLEPKFGLKMFLTYRALRQWVDDHKDEIMSSGASFNNTTHTIKFPNGARLLLGHEPEEFDRWRGCRFDFIHEAPERYDILLKD